LPLPAVTTTSPLPPGSDGPLARPDVKVPARARAAACARRGHNRHLPAASVVAAAARKAHSAALSRPTALPPCTNTAPPVPSDPPPTTHTEPPVPSRLRPFPRPHLAPTQHP
jgi:hypothetical protein